MGLYLAVLVKSGYINPKRISTKFAKLSDKVKNPGIK